MQNQILIPVELCKFALSQRKTREIALWLYLKSVTSGHFLLNADLMGTICNALKYRTKKTAIKHLQWLIRLGWITVNGKTGSHRIISMNQLSRKYHHVSRSCGVFDVDEFDKIQGFFAATIITYLKRRKGQSAQRRHGARKYCPYPFISLTRLAKSLGVPRSTAVRHKNKAISDGFIHAKHQFDRILLPRKNYNFFKQLGGDETRNLVLRNNVIYEQKPDLITSFILLRRRGKHPGKKWTHKEDM